MDKNSNRLTAALDFMIELVLFALLLFMPLAFGVVHAWSEVVVMLTAVLLLILSAARQFMCRKTLFTSRALLPVFMFVAIAAFQLMPLPASWMSQMSPNTYEIKTRLLEQLPANTHIDTELRQAGMSSASSWMPLTFYCHATRRGLQLLLAIVSIFYAAVQTFRTPRRIKRLLITIALIGGLIALLSLLQTISNTDKIYWLVPVKTKTVANSGTFVNHSNFGQFINLSIGAALAVIFILLEEMRQMKRATVRQRIFHSEISVCLGMGAVVVLGITSLVMSLTRGGIISFLIAFAFTTVMLALKRTIYRRGWVIILLALIAFICVLYLGFDAVYNRLSTLHQLSNFEAGRLQILKDIANAWTRFPIFGTGLNTHAVVYPMFDGSTLPALAAHADNEYAQLLEEMGLAGLATAAMFAFSVWVAYARCIRNPSHPISFAAFGLGYGLLAIMVNSMSDFGQHLPANAILSAILAGLLLVLARTPLSEHDTPPDTPSFTRPALAKLSASACVLAAGILICLVFSKNGADNARKAEALWSRVEKMEAALEQKQWIAGPKEYVNLVQTAQKASQLQPENIFYHHWLNVYRWKLLTRNMDADNRIILPPRGIQSCHRIVDEFCRGIRLCPTYGESWSMAGQLACFVLAHFDGTDSATAPDARFGEKGKQWIKTGVSLAPHDAVSCFVAGLLELRQPGALGLQANASIPGYKHFRRSITLDSSYYLKCAAAYLDAGHPNWALNLCAGNITHVRQFVSLVSDKHPVYSETARRHLVHLLEIQAEKPSARSATLAELAGMYAAQGRSEEAIGLYNRALKIEYGNLEWRMKLVHLLMQIGQYDQAVHNARICLRLRPDYAPAQEMLERLSIVGNDGSD